MTTSREAAESLFWRSLYFLSFLTAYGRRPHGLAWWFDALLWVPVTVALWFAVGALRRMILLAVVEARVSELTDRHTVNKGS